MANKRFSFLIILSPIREEIQMTTFWFWLFDRIRCSTQVGKTIAGGLLKKWRDWYKVSLNLVLDDGPC
jgi:hypothetical protein